MLSKKIDLSRTESQVKAYIYMSSSDSWMHMDPVGLGKDVLVCSSQRSGIDVVHVHVSSMKSSMYFEVVYILVPTMAMDDWLRVSEVI